LQLRIVAYDSANPKQQATSLVTIAVTRNENAPQFERSLFTATVPESLQLGEFVAQINATDEDMVRVESFVQQSV
jgi:protocadherin Fat 4